MKKAALILGVSVDQFNFKKTDAKLKIILFICFCTLQMNAQSKIINPKKNWYFGVELGTNKALSNEFRFRQKQQFQFGVLAEYYLAKQWSLVGKVKYYDTEVVFDLPGGGFSDGATPYPTMDFRGKVISMPLNIKWEFRLVKNFKGFLTFGTAYNIETKNDYTIPGNPNPDVSMFQTNYFSVNFGTGFTYFFSDTIAVFISYEINSGGDKGNYKPFIDLGPDQCSATNRLTNFGIKYNFNK